MALVTLCVIGNPPHTNWIVEINGLLYSQKSSFKGKFTEFMEAEGGLHISLLHTPSPLQNTADTKRPPMPQITQYLKALTEIGYKVVSSSSLATANISGGSTGHNFTYIWTLSSQ